MFASLLALGQLPISHWGGCWPTSPGLSSADRARTGSTGGTDARTASRTAVPDRHMWNPALAALLPVRSALGSPDRGEPSQLVPLPLDDRPYGDKGTPHHQQSPGLHASGYRREVTLTHQGFPAMVQSWTSLPPPCRGPCRGEFRAASEGMPYDTDVSLIPLPLSYRSVSSPLLSGVRAARRRLPCRIASSRLRYSCEIEGRTQY